MHRFKNSIYFLLLLMAVGLNIYIRLFPSYLPQLKKQALINVENNIVREATEEVDKKYPDFAPLVKEAIIQELVQGERKDEKLFQKEINEEYERLKEPYQDEDHQTYFLEADPYCRMRFVRLILKNGYPGDKTLGGKVYDTFMLAPIGALVGPHRLLYYLSAYLYKLSVLILPNLTLKTFLFYAPIFFCVVFFIALYLFCNSFFSKTAGIFAIIFTGFAPMFFFRSSAGAFDTDVLNLLFPLLVIWCLAAALRSKTVLKNIFLSLVASFFLALYAYTWVGWWFIYLVIAAFFVFIFANEFCLHPQDIKMFKQKVLPYLFSLITFLGGTVVLCLLIVGIEPFSFCYKALMENLGLGRSFKASIWPFVEYTVPELTPGNSATVSFFLGGNVITVLSLASVLWVYIKEKKSKKKDIVVLLVFWTLSMFFASFKAIRFTLLLSVPLGICLGVGLSDILKLIFIKVRMLRSTKIKISVLSGVFLGLYLILSTLIARGIDHNSRVYPFLNDDMYNILSRIKKETPEHSVVNSWWHLGNWIKEIANRRTVVDPQIQYRPITYWMARALLTDNEKETIRILRMVNNSSDTLFEKIRSFMGDDFKSIAFLDKVLKSDLDGFDTICSKYGLPKALKEEVKSTIFIKEPGPSYFIVDSDMLGDMSSLSFLGNWDFAKVYAMQSRDVPKESVLHCLEDTFSLSHRRSETLYGEVMLSMDKGKVNEVLSERLEFSLGVGRGERKGDVVYFDNGIILELDGFMARKYIASEKRFEQFDYIFFFNGKHLTYIKCAYDKREVSGLGCLFVEDNGQWQSILLSSEKLGRSLFSRLYFMKAKGLKHFKPFILDNKRGIYVFAINWENG